MKSIEQIVQENAATSFPLTETKYGFMWGPLLIERAVSDPKGGIVLDLYTGHQAVEIRVTPKGHAIDVRRHEPNEYQREQWKMMQ